MLCTVAGHRLCSLGIHRNDLSICGFHPLFVASEPKPILLRHPVEEVHYAVLFVQIEVLPPLDDRKSQKIISLGCRIHCGSQLLELLIRVAKFQKNLISLEP